MPEIPPVLLEMLTEVMQGDWMGNIIMGLWGVVAIAGLAFVAALAVKRD